MRIGIDLGGTKIEGVVLDRDNRVREKIRRSTPQADYHAIVTSIAQIITELETKVATHCSVGIGTPGAISPYSGRIKNSNTVVLNGMDLRADLQALTDRAIYFANDANCMTLSESVDGAAEGASSVFGVIIGTGTGGGLVYEGKVITGANAIAGEWGHNPLPYLGPDEQPLAACYCGKQGCIETYLSGAGFSRLYASLGNPKLSAETIVERAEQGEAAAQMAIEIYAKRLARALSSVVNIFDPQVVVLAGGLSNLPGLESLCAEFLPQFVFSDNVCTAIKKAMHGDSSGVRGAAWLPPS